MPLQIDHGIQVAISAVEIQETTWHRLYLGGFTYKKDAKAYAEQLRSSSIIVLLKFLDEN